MNKWFYEDLGVMKKLYLINIFERMRRLVGIKMKFMWVVK